MLDRFLILFPFAFIVLHGFLPFMPKPRPLPPDMQGCFSCSAPVWLGNPIHMLIGLPILILLFTTAVKLMLALEGLPNHVVYRTVVPAMWTVFFVTAGFQLWRAETFNLPVTAYDYTSLIPYALFAVADFILAARLRKSNPQRSSSPSPQPETT